METPMTTDGISSVQTGLEVDGVIDLRKRAVVSGLETPDTLASGSYYQASSGVSKELYQVIQEKQVTGGTTGQLFGSDRTYVIPGQESSSANVTSAVEEREETADVGEKDKKKKRIMDTTSNIAKKYKDFKF